MFKYIITLSLFFTTSVAYTQNIYSALHLNDERFDKRPRPKKIIETDIYDGSNGKTSITSIKTFDNSGMILTEERFNENNQLEAKLIYTNDTTVRLIRSIYIERFNSIINQSQTDYYTYDSNNFLIKVEDKNKGFIFLTTLIKNDAKGHPIEVETLNANGVSYGKELGTYLYDKNRVITSVINNNGKVLSLDTLKISFKIIDTPANNEVYNERGDLISYVSKNIKGNPIHYENKYKYDATGNCIDEEVFKIIIKPNGKLKESFERAYLKRYFY